MPLLDLVRSKPLWFLSALGLGAVMFLLPFEARAVDFGLNALLKGIVGMISGIADLLWKVAGMAARFMAWILVDFNQNIGFVKSPFVQAGWAAVRDVANWLFIITLVVSAVATILDMPQAYNARKILPKLIIVALLINFSLFFTGFLINFSQAVMSIFVVQGVSQYGDIGNALANAMRFGDSTSSSPGEYITIDKAVRDAKGIGNYEEEGILMAFHIIRGIFAVVSTFVFLFLAIMLIIRIAFLWMVMILSPLALASAVYPALNKFWSEWLNMFVRWTFFGVLIAFFLWLSVYLTFVASSTTFSQQNFAIDGGGFVSILMALAESFLQYLIVTIFLLMSVKFSKQFAGEGAGIASRWAGKMVSAPGLAAIAGGSAGVAALRAQVRRTGLPGRVGERIQRTPILRRVPGVKQISVGAIQKQRKYDEDRFSGSEQKYRNMSTEQLETLARSSTGTDAAAINFLLTQRGTDTEPLFRKRTRRFTQRRRRYNLRLAERAGRAGRLLNSELTHPRLRRPPDDVAQDAMEADLFEPREGETVPEALARYISTYGGPSDMDELRRILGVTAPPPGTPPTP